ncbi:coenzyme F420-0:L-glutamate ligase [Arsenicicoccus dermatophilus]|uniref:coenzyme F420-0:L-glutamate ligase n=1 Tax=Arsenicicoccus dermatophilus TaxID=1076331 RepID=UPI001F4D0825|nr:coenzyme F420-0:L-glutamate ligase [Arsenicicoccus dermatophilus]
MSTAAGRVEIHPVLGVPEVIESMQLAAELTTAAAGSVPGGLRDGDLLVVSSKLVSKAEGLRRPWAGDRDVKDELVRSQTVRVVAERATQEGITRIVEAVAGPVMAAAGIDASNTGDQGGLLVLPEDPDAAAEELRQELRVTVGVEVGVLLTDTAGRPWRGGQVDLALGCAGLAPADDLRGGVDHDGRCLTVTSRAIADEVAAAADLVKGKATGIGAAVVRGLAHLVGPDRGPGARSLVRTGPGDWFALGHVEAVRAALGAPPGSPASERAGIRPLAVGELAARRDRAVRLALLTLPQVTSATADGGRIRLVAADETSLGRALARLEFACAAEDLVVAQEDVSGAGAEVLLSAR